MKSNNDAAIAAAELLKTGVAVPFRLREEVVIPGVDEGEFGMRLELDFVDDEDPEGDPSEVVQWGALGFLFVIGVLSFADARPRGMSEPEFVAADDFRVSDFLANLRFRRGELHLDTDYIRGRRMKTRVTVRPAGTVTIETVGRGKAPAHWIGRLKGGIPLRAIS